ncbi:uncharacterized protein LOC131606200 [Vicia villosa]|uniref:uncharacterized protein LOC131606200 n=1 Tax=Vicia villosa TaxID=3911 RepID=UPI00273AA09D|nr:uncharacterized protein LOC131606200 [Vicia villosa]
MMMVKNLFDGEVSVDKIKLCIISFHWISSWIFRHWTSRAYDKMVSICNVETCFLPLCLFNFSFIPVCLGVFSFVVGIPISFLLAYILFNHFEPIDFKVCIVVAFNINLYLKS